MEVRAEKRNQQHIHRTFRNQVKAPRGSDESKVLVLQAAVFSGEVLTWCFSLSSTLGWVVVTLVIPYRFLYEGRIFLNFE